MASVIVLIYRTGGGKNKYFAIISVLYHWTAATTGLHNDALFENTRAASSQQLAPRLPAQVSQPSLLDFREYQPPSGTRA